MKILRENMQLSDFIAAEHLSKLESRFGQKFCHIDDLTPDVVMSLFDGMDDNDVDNLAEAFESEWFADQVQRITGLIIPRSNVSFGAFHAVNPMSFIGEAAKAAYNEVKAGVVSYKERQRLKCALRQINSKMHSKDEKKRREGEIEFAQAMASMSKAEMVQFVKVCMEIIGNSKLIDEAADRVMNRDRMGKMIKCKIVVSDSIELRRELGISDNHKLFIMIEKDGRRYPVKMTPVATVIYVMNLICRQKDAEDMYNTINVYDNRAAFENVYKEILNDKTESEISQRLTTVLEEGRLKEYYNEIESRMTDVLKEIGEEVSPFLVNQETPLVINKENISMPENLKTFSINVASEKKQHNFNG